jgi:hypoxanthine phosphoribosyltransferase
MSNVKLKDLEFEILLSKNQINLRLQFLSAQLTQQFSNENPLFVAVLNGSFIFAADLLRQLNFACEVQFVKVSSYAGTASTGEVKQVLGLQQSIENRTVILIEDIIDSGLTIDYLQQELSRFNPKTIKICTLLLKPKALKVPLTVDYVGFEVANDFLVGYGLDYDGLGRNLPHIYKTV